MGTGWLDDIDGYRTLLSDLGHDLRTPLTVIRGAATLLHHSLDEIPKDRQLEMLNLIDRESEAMSDRIEDMLVLAKLEAGHLTLESSSVALGEVLEPALAWARKRGWRGTLGDGGEGATPVGADRDRAAQALRRLVDVGFQSAGQAMTVATASESAGARIEIGLGKMEGLDAGSEAVFNPLGGQLGFGPHLARGLIRAMGGEVRIARLRDGAAAFSVTFPGP